MTAASTVLVVGAGIAGAATAIRLADAGVAVELVETKPGVTALGSGITLQGNALRELRGLGVWEQVRDLGCAHETTVLRSADGTVQTELHDVKAGGAVVAVVGLFVTATSTVVPMIQLGWCVATLGTNAVIAALLPLLHDHVPADQRGRISGLLGMGLPVGAVGGAFLAQAFVGNTLLMFLAPSVVLVVGVGALVLSFTDRRLDATQARALPRFGLREFASSFWVSPRRHPDFAWTWWSRFLLFMAVGTLVTFQAFYLINQLDVSVTQVAQVVGLSTLVHYAFVFVASPLGGWLSDRLRRRKVFVGVAALLYAVGLVFVATADSLPMFLVGMAITGIGEGIYLAVDLALVTEVIPGRHEAAKIMGVFTTANTLPIALAPAVAPLFLAIPLFAREPGDNYVALFVGSALFALIGALVIRPVRSVR